MLLGEKKKFKSPYQLTSYSVLIPRKKKNLEWIFPVPGATTTMAFT